MKKQRVSELIILASTAFMILTLVVFVNFFKSGKNTSLSSKAAGFDRRAYGKGKTELVEFDINLRNLNTPDKNKGYFRVVTLSPNDEIDYAVFNIENISWHDGTTIIFTTGHVDIAYKDGSKSTKATQVLLVDQSDIPPDLGGEYLDVLGIRFCEDEGCTSTYAPWMPWSVIEGDLVVE